MKLRVKVFYNEEALNQFLNENVHYNLSIHAPGKLANQDGRVLLESVDAMIEQAGDINSDSGKISTKANFIVKYFEYETSDLCQKEKNDKVAKGADPYDFLADEKDNGSAK